MNIKSITTLGLVAVALAVTSLNPAEARNNNNDKALNQLAMQYYAQNQAAAGNNSVYNQAMAADAIMHPDSYARYNNGYGSYNPYATAASNYGYNNTYGFNPLGASVNPYTASASYDGCNNGYGNTGFGNSVFGNTGFSNRGYNNVAYNNGAYNNLARNNVFGNISSQFGRHRDHDRDGQWRHFGR